MTALEVDVTSFKAITKSYFAIRSQFFAVFIQDKVGKTSKADQKLINEGNFAAHRGDLLINAMMYKKRIRADDKTFAILYDMS